MLIPHKTHLPAFMVVGIPNQYPICVLTVLSINETVGDCAAYRGVCPDFSKQTPDYKAKVIEATRAGGNKIDEEEARSLFPEIEQKGLRYRR